jgi:hypothetical protein
VHTGNPPLGLKEDPKIFLSLPGVSSQNLKTKSQKGTRCLVFLICCSLRLLLPGKSTKILRERCDPRRHSALEGAAIAEGLLPLWDNADHVQNDDGDGEGEDGDGEGEEELVGHCGVSVGLAPRRATQPPP